MLPGDVIMEPTSCVLLTLDEAGTIQSLDGPIETLGLSPADAGRNWNSVFEGWDLPTMPLADTTPPISTRVLGPNGRCLDLIRSFNLNGTGKVGQYPYDDGANQDDAAHAFQKQFAAVPHMNHQAFRHGHAIGGQLHDKRGITAFKESRAEQTAGDDR